MKRARTSVPKGLALIAVGALLFGAAACSSDDSSSSSDTSASSGSASGGLTEAKANVDRLLQAPTTVGVTTPIKEAAPADVSVAFLECPIPDCAAFSGGAEDAAAELGWDFTSINYDLTPESSQAAFDQALAGGANVILSVGSDPSWLTEQRKVADEQGVVFVDCCTLYESDAATATGDYLTAENPPAAVINNVDFIQHEASTIADYAAVETDGKVKGLTIYVPDFPIGGVTADAIDKRLAEVCPDSCSSEPLEVSVNDLGTNVGPRVVSALQRDPSINYLFFITGDFAGGVTPSLVEAGMADQVKMVGNSGNLTTFEEMAAGDVEQAWLGVPLEVEGWRMVDMALRTLQGEAIPPTSSPEDTGIGAWPTFQILTAENYPDPEPYLAPANFRDIFKELWLLN